MTSSSSVYLLKQALDALPTLEADLQSRRAAQRRAEIEATQTGTLVDLVKMRRTSPWRTGAAGGAIGAMLGAPLGAAAGRLIHPSGTLKGLLMGAGAGATALGAVGAHMPHLAHKRLKQYIGGEPMPITTYTPEGTDTELSGDIVMQTLKAQRRARLRQVLRGELRHEPGS